jgi:hypothetical protein
MSSLIADECCNRCTLHADCTPTQHYFRGSNLVAQDLPQARQNPQIDEDELLAVIVSARISEPDQVAGVLNEPTVESAGHLGWLDHRR